MRTTQVIYCIYSISLIARLHFKTTSSMPNLGSLFTQPCQLAERDRCARDTLMSLLTWTIPRSLATKAHALSIFVIDRTPRPLSEVLTSIIFLHRRAQRQEQQTGLCCSRSSSNKLPYREPIKEWRCCIIAIPMVNILRNQRIPQK